MKTHLKTPTNPDTRRRAPGYRRPRSTTPSQSFEVCLSTKSVPLPFTWFIKLADMIAFYGISRDTAMRWVKSHEVPGGRRTGPPPVRHVWGNRIYFPRWDDITKRSFIRGNQGTVVGNTCLRLSAVLPPRRGAPTPGKSPAYPTRWTNASTPRSTQRWTPTRKRKINMTYTTNTLSPEMVADAKATLRARFIADRRTTTADFSSPAVPRPTTHTSTTSVKSGSIRGYPTTPPNLPRSPNGTGTSALRSCTGRPWWRMTGRTRTVRGRRIRRSCESLHVPQPRPGYADRAAGVPLAEFIPIAGEDILLKDTHGPHHNRAVGRIDVCAGFGTPKR